VSTRLATRPAAPLVAALARPRPRLVGALVVAVLLAVAAFSVGYLVAKPSHPGENSPEAGFARDMSEHHAQAVEMGMIEFQQGQDPDIRTLGGDIAITQQGQIGVMSSWLQQWGVSTNSTNPPMSWMPEGQRALNGNLMPGMATRDEVNALKAATGKQVDILFCQYMLRHHLGGIHMVDGILAETSNPTVRALAETMKKNQSGEVTVLENMLKDLGAQPLK
jgi:uncharacterized protein (DUF305 family)